MAPECTQPAVWRRSAAGSPDQFSDTACGWSDFRAHAYANAPAALHTIQRPQWAPSLARVAALARRGGAQGARLYKLETVAAQTDPVGSGQQAAVGNRWAPGNATARLRLRAPSAPRLQLRAPSAPTSPRWFSKARSQELAVSHAEAEPLAGLHRLTADHCTGLVARPLVVMHRPEPTGQVRHR